MVPCLNEEILTENDSANSVASNLSALKEKVIVAKQASECLVPSPPLEQHHISEFDVVEIQVPVKQDSFESLGSKAKSEENVSKCENPEVEFEIVEQSGVSEPSIDLI